MASSPENTIIQQVEERLIYMKNLRILMLQLQEKDTLSETEQTELRHVLLAYDKTIEECESFLLSVSR